MGIAYHEQTFLGGKRGPVIQPGAEIPQNWFDGVQMTGGRVMNVAPQNAENPCSTGMRGVGNEAENANNAMKIR